MRISKDVKITIGELKSHLINPVNSGTNQLIAVCPYCNDKTRFYLNKTNLLWDCKKCKEEGNAKKLLSRLGVLDQYLHATLDLGRLVKLGETFEEEEEEIKLPNDKLPFFFERTYNHPYLLGRDLTVKDFYKYKIGICPKSQTLRDYIVISVEEDGICKGYVSRCMKSKEEIEEFDLLRYKNSGKTKFGQLLFGIDEITKKTKIVIVVEGIFDKIRLDNLLQTDDDETIKVACTFGNKMSEGQLRKLKKTNVEEIILFYDLDAVGEMKKNVPKIKKFFDVRIACLLDGKDPGDAPADEVIQALHDNYDTKIFFFEKCNGRKIKIKSQKVF